MFRGYSTQESAFSKVACFILRACTGTSISLNKHRNKTHTHTHTHTHTKKNLGEVLEEKKRNVAGKWTGRVEISKEATSGSKRSMHGNILTYSRL